MDLYLVNGFLGSGKTTAIARACKLLIDENIKPDSGRIALGGKFDNDVWELYNLNEDRYSPYQNPIIRIGFGFGI